MVYPDQPYRYPASTPDRYKPVPRTPEYASEPLLSYAERPGMVGTARLSASHQAAFYCINVLALPSHNECVRGEAKCRAS